MKILWFSRHAPLPSQSAELRRIFGADTEIGIDHRPYSGATDILARCKAFEAAEFVIVGPVEVLSELCLHGAAPLVCDVEAQGMTRNRTRSYVHKGFKRVRSVSMDMEEL